LAQISNFSGLSNTQQFMDANLTQFGLYVCVWIWFTRREIKERTKSNV